jgi:hypothetical protein
MENAGLARSVGVLAMVLGLLRHLGQSTGKELQLLGRDGRAAGSAAAVMF